MDFVALAQAIGIVGALCVGAAIYVGWVTFVVDRVESVLASLALAMSPILALLIAMMYMALTFVET